MRIAPLLLPAALCLLAAACLNDSTFNVQCPDPVVTTTSKAGDTTVVSNGLRYLDTSVGTGAEAVHCRGAAVSYVGRLADSARTVFDSTSTGSAFSFIVGARQVIPGFEQGVLGMKVGGKRRVIIPSTLGYGTQGAGAIPPNSTLVFDVTLLSVEQ